MFFVNFKVRYCHGILECHWKIIIKHSKLRIYFVKFYIVAEIYKGQ